MPNTREKLMRLLCHANSKATEAEAFEDATYAEQLGIQADHLIANGVTVQKWISVKDRLPKNNECYITFSKFDLFGKTMTNVGYCEFDKEIGFYEFVEQVDDTFRKQPIDDVTHWMPFPGPPKED